MKPIGKWLVIICLLSVCLCSILEVYLRFKGTYIVRHGEFIESNPQSLILHTPRGKRLVPNARVTIRNHYTSGRNISMQINSLGFRDREIPELKADDELRILILGDSITWGNYLEAAEVYVERIEHYLRQSVDSQNINVVNAGAGDIGLKEEICILLERGLSVKPDIVMVSFYLNDSRPPWGFTGERASPGWLRRHSLLVNSLYYRLRLWAWINKGGKQRFDWVRKQDTLDWTADREDFLRLASAAKYDWGAAWEAASYNIIDQELGKLKLLAAWHSFQVAIVVFPVKFQVYADFIENTPQRILEQKAEKLGFYYFDLLPVLRGHNNEELFFDFCHPRKKTNDIIGKEIAEFIKREIMKFAERSGKSVVQRFK